jgi:WD40 repeat protein
MATKADPALYGPRAGVLAPVGAAERGVASVLAASPCGQWLAYGSGPNVVVRSVADPALALVYDGHGAATVKVAKFSPSGAYVASGDDAGRCRVWAFTNPEHPLKYELPSIGGPIEDLAWDGEGKRIAVVGGGQAKAKVFAWDTGSSLAPEVVPHAKKNLCVDLKPTRPFKAVWGGEDFALSLYGGPPFKYERSLKEHSNFVNCVRYAPDGSKFVSVASDKQGLVYDGVTGELAGRLDPAAGHAGSVYHCAWAPDGLRLATSGACAGGRGRGRRLRLRRERHSSGTRLRGRCAVGRGRCAVGRQACWQRERGG